MPAWVYEAENRELRFVCPHFAQSAVGVTRVSWHAGIRNGAAVNPGVPLADLTWDDGRVETLQAPPGCAGVVDSTNRQIEYASLHRRPSQWALRLNIP